MHLTSAALAPATVVNYMADLRAFLRWSETTGTGNGLPLGLDAEDIEAYCSYLRETKNHPPATINRRLQAMRKFYDFAVAQGWTPANPASQVQLFGEVVSERTRFLTPDDIGRLLAAVRCGQPRRMVRDLAIIQVLLQSGLKLSELTDLRLADVCLDAEPPYLNVCGGSEEPSRSVPLDGEVCEALRAYLPYRHAALGVDRLFVNRDGNLLSTRSVQRLLHYYARSAGLDKLTTQALRYAYARGTYERSGDVKTVGRLLGHRHLATTIRYLRPCPAQDQQSEGNYATEL